jgi:hypothetical protein
VVQSKPAPALALALLAAAGGACRTSYEDASRSLARDALVDPRPPIVERQRSFYAGDTSRPRLESTYRVHAGGFKVLHGPERAWYESGVLRWEREYRDGEPCGRWASYYESGAQESESWPDAADAGEHVTTWWHPNGELSSRGPTVRGAREGRWSSWYPDGTLRSEGDYSGNLREGEWTFWHEDGRVAERGSYAAGVRIGSWERDPR